MKKYFEIATITRGAARGRLRWTLVNRGKAVAWSAQSYGHVRDARRACTGVNPGIPVRVKA